MPTVELNHKVVSSNSVSYNFESFFLGHVVSPPPPPIITIYSFVKCQIAGHKVASDPDKKVQHENEQLMLHVPELSEPSQPDQNSQTGMLEMSEEFVPGTMCE